MGDRREDQRLVMVNSDEELIAALKKINERLKSQKSKKQ